MQHMLFIDVCLRVCLCFVFVYHACNAKHKCPRWSITDQQQVLEPRALVIVYLTGPMASEVVFDWWCFKLSWLLQGNLQEPKYIEPHWHDDRKRRRKEIWASQKKFPTKKRPISTRLRGLARCVRVPFYSSQVVGRCSVFF